MVSLVVRYARERSPLPFTVLLAFLLFSAGLQGTDVSVFAYARGFASMVLFLFLIRLSDDICDIPIDRVTHPDRLLCREGTDLGALDRFRLLAVAVIGLLQLPDLGALAFIALTVGFFALFFRLKPSMPTLVHTAILNGSLFVFPVYAGVLLYGEVRPMHLLFGMFFWTGGLAHDTSHSLLDVAGRDPSTLNPINRLDQRFLAGFSLALYTVSASIGAGMFLAGMVGVPFAVCLVLTSLVVVYLEVPLIAHPSEETARLFYVFGFAFFLLPALAQIGTVLSEGL